MGGNGLLITKLYYAKAKSLPKQNLKLWKTVYIKNNLLYYTQNYVTSTQIIDLYFTL